MLHWSAKYLIEEDSYPVEREERMIAQLDDFFWKAFFYLRMNRIEGDYLEFGCGSNMRSFRLAAKYRRLEKPAAMRLFAFDSFEGLPEPLGVDVHPQWRKGLMKVSLEQFKAELVKQGVSEAEYATVPGFYDRTLRGHVPTDYGISKMSMAFIDCDLYASTKDALAFIKADFQDGAIIAFDDWFCFGGDPDLGRGSPSPNSRRGIRSSYSRIS
jgi:hypothetical protein